jgi:hypothetical protein
LIDKLISSYSKSYFRAFRQHQVYITDVGRVGAPIAIEASPGWRPARPNPTPQNRDI